MAGPELCPRHQKPIPPDAPWGLCPGCLFEQAMGEIGSEPTGSDGPESTVDDADSPTRDYVSVPSTAEFDEHATRAPEPPDPNLPRGVPEFVGRYRLGRRIGRGGMGEVIRGRDVEIGREIALKVLKEDLRDDPDLVLRFVEEARIGGQLVHPAIVPVYERGTLPDGRPFFVMKLVEGETLADLLKSRSDPLEDQPRFLAIFEQVCQAMAYAHSAGVIHRDLKSLNVMVGAFGEVQTMDWGLAKLLSSPNSPISDRAIRTIRDGVDASVAGQAKGTPSSMPPEQARGEVDRIDERADVFGLGAILCEILTGHPPYRGKSHREILDKAAQADLAEALARLDACGADAELTTLARHCLAPDRDHRPRDAGEVASAMAAHFATVQDRLRRAELDRAKAETRAEEETKQRVLADKLALEAEARADTERKLAREAEARAAAERKRLRATLALAASLILLLAVGGTMASWLRDREVVASRAFEDAQSLRDRALADIQNPAAWSAAVEEAKRAEGLLAFGISGGTRRKVMDLRKEVEQTRELLDTLVDIRSSGRDDLDGSASDAAYAAAFRKAGIDVDAGKPVDVAARIRAYPQDVVLAITSVLNQWTLTRRFLKNLSGSKQLNDVCKLNDPDPWRNRLRDALSLRDETSRRVVLRELADSRKSGELDAIDFEFLGRGLMEASDFDMAEKVLRKGQHLHPLDIWINYFLASCLHKLHRRDEAVKYYSVARALRPETAFDLAELLSEKGETDEAIAVYRDLTRLRPKMGLYLGGFGTLLKSRGDSESARLILETSVSAFREEIKLKPDFASHHNNLGRALNELGRPDEAVAEYREAIRIKFDYPEAHSNLGIALRNRGKFDEAAAEYREAIRIKPDYSEAHINLGVALSDRGKIDEAVAEYREAIRIKPDNALSHNNLGNALSDQGKFDEAVAEYREAIRIKFDYPEAHSNLGIALRNRGKFDEAAAEFREAIRIKPDYPEAHNNLGATLSKRGKIDEAVAEYREAIRIKPDYAESYINLAFVLRFQGDYAGSLAMLRRGHELGSNQPGWRLPSAQWVVEAERLTSLADRLPGILRGEDQPKDASEQLALARLCYDTKRFATAARFLEGALQSDPKLGPDRGFQLRSNAAKAATLAAAGLGKDDSTPDEAMKVKLRGQALGWLKAELEISSTTVESGPPRARPGIVQYLKDWQENADLASIRDPKALARLPEAEREDWEAFWAGVETLIEKASRPSTGRPGPETKDAASR